LKNKCLTAGLLYETQQVKLTADFFWERREEPEVDGCCKLRNSCCPASLETYLVRKIQRKYCTTLHSVSSRSVTFHSALVLE